MPGTPTEQRKTESAGDEELADDMLEGAEAIAEFLFGTADVFRNRRKVYYLAQRSKLPLFRLGTVLCARKSVLREFIAGQEVRGMPQAK